MTKVWAVYWREVQAYFLSPVAYVFMAVFLLLTGWFFAARLFATQYIEMQVVFANMTFMFVFIAPLLTMRLLAEERRMGTDEFLLTAPLTVGQIVVGKFLAAVTVYLAFLAVTGVYPWLLYRYGFPDWVTIGTGYLGVILVGAAYLAVGVLASSLTNSQMVAGLLGFGVLLLSLVVDRAAVVSTGLLAKVLQAISISARANGLYMGVLNVADLFYLISFTGGLLFLTVRVMERRRWL
ncbi:MAG: ABC transporter permease [Bacillota bacterium]|nr:MAG: ABC transporter permease [Bacillota bacterium]